LEKRGAGGDDRVDADGRDDEADAAGGEADAPRRERRWVGVWRGASDLELGETRGGADEGWRARFRT
jgi:hypothetical protein